MTLRVDHVVWDWNGTLFDDTQLAITSTIEAFATLDLPEVTRDRYQQLHTQPIPLFYERLAGRRLTQDEQCTLRDAYQSAYHRRHDRMSLTSDAADALGWVTRQGLSQSLLSMYPHAALLPLVQRLGIASCFARIDGQPGPDTGAKADYLATHLGRLGLSGERVLLVGDSVDDARAAARVGASCVLYASGSHAPEALRRENVAVATSLLEALCTGVGGDPP